MCISFLLKLFTKTFIQVRFPVITLILPSLSKTCSVTSSKTCSKSERCRHGLVLLNTVNAYFDKKLLNKQAFVWSFPICRINMQCKLKANYSLNELTEKCIFKLPVGFFLVLAYTSNILSSKAQGVLFFKNL